LEDFFCSLIIHFYQVGFWGVLVDGLYHGLGIILGDLHRVHPFSEHSSVSVKHVSSGINMMSLTQIRTFVNMGQLRAGLQSSGIYSRQFPFIISCKFAAMILWG
jgi:hypothetical protein